jgi:eukaryotic-like serine/threonine-protein kinase
MNIEVGSAVGDYQVLGILGMGGMGQVYKVRNLISDRIEAMKVLLPDLTNSPELADRFLREIKLQAGLEHPTIAALHTAVRIQNRLLMVMEYVEGVTLEQRLQAGPLPAGEAIEYMSQVLAALEYAHARGVIHRDIKPSNMMLTVGGRIKLMDFGIAKGAGDQRLTMTGATLGSLYYMSPEQIQGAAALDARSDLYSAGVSLYQLITGKRPFDGDSQFAIMSAHLQNKPTPPISLEPRLPQSLNDVILRSVAKDPNTRFQTAAAFRAALRDFVEAAPAPPSGEIEARKEDTRPQAASTGGAKRAVWMALGGLAAVLVIAGVVEVAPWKSPRAAPAAQIPPAVAPAPQAVPAGSPASSAPTAQQEQPAEPQLQRRPAEPRQRVQPQPPDAQQSAPPPQPTASQPDPVPVQAAAPPVLPPPKDTSDPRELEQIRERFVLLRARATAVRSSLAALQRMQAASGLNLRGDVQEAASLMDSFLQGADEALTSRDLTAARSLLEKAEPQIERLEKFLNR